MATADATAAGDDVAVFADELSELPDVVMSDVWSELCQLATVSTAAWRACTAG